MYFWQHFNNLTKPVNNIAGFSIAMSFLKCFILILLLKNQKHKMKDIWGTGPYFEGDILIYRYILCSNCVSLMLLIMKFEKILFHFGNKRIFFWYSEGFFPLLLLSKSSLCIERVFKIYLFLILPTELEWQRNITECILPNSLLCYEMCTHTFTYIKYAYVNTHMYIYIVCIHIHMLKFNDLRTESHILA